MPSAIKRIAQTQLQNPAEIMVAAKTGTADNIRQRYWLVSGMHKLDALTRLLEAEDYDGIIVFARTKLATEELAVKLMARGFSAAAINGDMQQQHRERTVGQLKDGSIDILVATDVAARGLDVDRISHVINYDVPSDPESYTHRIGRTGRAGRSGEAILFITPRERSLLKSIERSTRQPISQLELPTITTVNNVRIARFKEQISQTLADGDLDVFAAIIEAYENEHNVPAIEIAAALAKMSRGGVPLLLARPERGAKPGPDAPGPMASSPVSPFQTERSEDRPVRAARKSAPPFERPARADPARAEPAPAMSSPDSAPPSTWRDRASQAAHEPIDAKPARLGSQAYRIEIGHIHGVKPGNIVGAIANETGLEAKHIGRIEIFDTYSLIELSAGLPKKTLKHLQTVRVGSQPLRISESDVMPRPAVKRPRKPS
jgi:ATP-dependent RNA helicase DeaD